MDEDITYNMISMGSQGADVGARIALLKPLGCAAAVGDPPLVVKFLRCGKTGHQTWQLEISINDGLVFPERENHRTRCGEFPANHVLLFINQFFAAILLIVFVEWL